MTDAIMPRLLLTSKQVRDIELAYAQYTKSSTYNLMEKAGVAVWQHIEALYPSIAQLAIFCGKGNNAGDGYEVARLAKASGKKVRVIVMDSTPPQAGDAKIAYQKMIDAGLTVELLSASLASLDACDLIVDAILGTGISGEVREGFAQAIERVNMAQKPVVAIDVPSGLIADTGMIAGHAIKATHTVTFIGVKAGLVTGDSAECVGQLHFAPLGVKVEDFLEDEKSVHPKSEKHLCRFDDFYDRCQPRRANTHKGESGHCLIVGGNQGMMGAVKIAAHGALRIGSGLVSVLTHPTHAQVINTDLPEIMIRESFTDVSNLNSSASLVFKKNAIAIGPGLGTNEWSLLLWKAILACRSPLVVDADALNLLAANPIKKNDWILTPHPGEAARLLGVTSKEVQNDRWTAVEKLREMYGGIVVLKGAGTLVCYKNALTGRITTMCVKAGNPGMASGGMGDLLTGCITGLIAQGYVLELAAQLGVIIHAYAGDRASAQRGEKGMLASDLLPFIQELHNELSNYSKASL